MTNPATGIETYPEMLKAAGYYTGYFGKFDVGVPRSQGFEKAANLFDFWNGDHWHGNYWHEEDCLFVQTDGLTNKTTSYCDCPPADKPHISHGWGRAISPARPCIPIGKLRP